MDILKKGVFWASSAAIISGFSIFINKYAVAAVSPPMFLTTSKNVFVGLVFISLVLVFGKIGKIHKLSKGDLTKLVIISLVGGSLPFYLFFTGLATTTAINAAIIQKTLVVWVAIMAIPYLKERISVLGVLSVMLLFIGNTYIGGFSGFKFSGGELMILAATLLWACESIIAKRVLKSVDVDIVAAFRMGLGSLVLLTAMFASSQMSLGEIASVGQTQIFWIALTSVLLFGYVRSWYMAISLMPVVSVTSILVASTLVTNALSAVFVTRTWSVGMLIQSLLIMVGILLSYVSYRKMLGGSVQKNNLAKV